MVRHFYTWEKTSILWSCHPSCLFSWKYLSFCELWTYNTYTSTLHRAYTPSTLKSSPILSAYHFTNWPKQHPYSALCRTPTNPPLAHSFCLCFTPIQPCHNVTSCLFFKWSLCRNRFPIARCSCLQVWYCKTPSSIAASPVSAAQTNPSTASPAGLQLCVDRFSYPLQQLPCTGSPSPRLAAHQHPMVLRPQQPKTALSTSTTTAAAASFS